jgi:hypothetical protein
MLLIIVKRNKKKAANNNNNNNNKATKELPSIQLQSAIIKLLLLSSSSLSSLDFLLPMQCMLGLGLL